MGKQKRHREKPHKKNPTGLLSVKDFDEIEDTAKGEKERALLSVYDGMQSGNIEEQLSSLETLETIALDVSMAEQIAKDGIAKTVGPLLLYNNASVRAAAASTLRQIASKGYMNIVTNLMKDDIMTPLSALLKQYYSNWTYKKDHKDEKDTYVQAIILLWTLCESNEDAIKHVNEQNLVSILTKYLDINSYDMGIIVPTMQCLITLAEDNVEAIIEIKSNIAFLHDIMTKLPAEQHNDSEQYEIWFLKISSFGFLNNIYNSNDTCKSIYVNIFIKILNEVLSVDNKQLLSNLVSILPHEENAASINKRKKVTEIKMVLLTQQMTLEILTNLSFDDNNEDDVKSTGSDDSEKMGVNSIPMDVDNTNENLRSFPIELIEAFNHYNFIGKIWEKTVAMDTNSEEILDQIAEGKSMLACFYIIRCRAYICLNNLLPNFDIDTLGGIDYLYSKWLEIGKVVVEDIKVNKLELLDSALYIMRAITDRLTCIQANVFTQLNEANFQLILNNEIQTRNTAEHIRVNMMRILGILAFNLMRNKNQLTNRTYDMAKHISEILLDSCMGETAAWVLAETIDAIMDLFAEDETDYLAFDVQLIQRLRSLVPAFKDKVRQQKDKLKGRMAVVSTVNANIWRFIKYKEKQIRKFK